MSTDTSEKCFSICPLVNSLTCPHTRSTANPPQPRSVDLTHTRDGQVPLESLFSVGHVEGLMVHSEADGGLCNNHSSDNADTVENC